MIIVTSIQVAISHPNFGKYLQQLRHTPNQCLGIVTQFRMIGGVNSLVIHFHYKRVITFVMQLSNGTPIVFDSGIQGTSGSLITRTSGTDDIPKDMLLDMDESEESSEPWQ